MLVNSIVLVLYHLSPETSYKAGVAKSLSVDGDIFGKSISANDYILFKM